jgi:uncharacterized phosphosugar-binding protein
MVIAIEIYYKMGGRGKCTSLLHNDIMAAKGKREKEP